MPTSTSPPAQSARNIEEQVLPEVSQNARDTLQGMLEVRVQARVNASGKVMDAKLDSPGPSRYFATRALDAARRWKFKPVPPENDTAPQEWLLRFDFTKSRTDAFSERVTR
jgi:TonB family protein